MDADVTMRGLILETPGVTAQVATRVYPSQLPDDVTLPAVVYDAISDEPRYTNATASDRRECARMLRYEINSYAATLAKARLLDTAIRAGLSGYRGSAGGGLVAVWRQTSYPAFYEAENFWRVVTDYMVHVSE